MCVKSKPIAYKLLESILVEDVFYISPLHRSLGVYMKIYVILAFVISSNFAFAISSDGEMNSELVTIYNFLVSQESSSQLLGKKYTLKLSLKFASEKHLIFNDAYIRVDDKTKYQIAKWQFEEIIVSSIKGKRDIICDVAFIIKDVENKGLYSEMPHIVVEVLNINPEQNQP